MGVEGIADLTQDQWRDMPRNRPYAGSIRHRNASQKSEVFGILNVTDAMVAWLHRRSFDGDQPRSWIWKVVIQDATERSGTLDKRWRMTIYTQRDLYAVDGRPSQEDVAQNNFSNCYFIASAAAVAMQTPDELKSLISYDETTQEFSVRLYDETSSAWKTYTVTQAEIQSNIDSGGGSRIDNDPDGHHPVWPAVLEVGYAKSLGGNPADDWSVYDSGGYPDAALVALTGKRGTNLTAESIEGWGWRLLTSKSATPWLKESG